MRIPVITLGLPGTRVGQRTLLSFLLAALLPASVISVFGVWYVRQSLIADASERIERTAKAASLILQGEMASAKLRFADRPDADLAEAEFTGGTDVEMAHLDAGNVLLRTTPPPDFAGDRPATLYRKTSAGRIIGRPVNPAMMWPVVDGLVEYEGIALCVFDVATWERIHCNAPTSADAERRLRLAVSAVKDGTESISDDTWLLAYRELYLRFEFASPEWRLVVAEERAAAVAPAKALTLSLIILLALAAVTAIVLAVQQIRRSTAPLEQLRDATRRVAGGDLNTPVEIRSRDEYGELGVAFNGMTNALASQLSLLHRLDAVDEATLRQRQIDAIIAVALEGFRNHARCSKAKIVIAGTPPDSSGSCWVIESGVPDLQRRDVDLTWTERRRLLSNPRFVVRPQLAGSDNVSGVQYAPSVTHVDFPLIHDDELLGVMTLALTTDAEHHQDDCQSARRIADRVTLGVWNVQLLDSLEALSTGTLQTLARAIDANSPWTAGHSERVTRLSLALGQVLALSRADMATLFRGGLLHDLGKISIPPAVLDKPSKLNPEERALIERHPEVGEEILKPLPVFAAALPIVRSHHEKFDGTGYPDQLAGEDIPWLARILAVADVYDALVSDRPYRAGLSHRAAATIIEAGAGSHFDPNVVAAFRQLDFNDIYDGHARTPLALSRGDQQGIGTIPDREGGRNVLEQEVSYAN